MGPVQATGWPTAAGVYWIFSIPFPSPRAELDPGVEMVMEPNPDLRPRLQLHTGWGRLPADASRPRYALTTPTRARDNECVRNHNCEEGPPRSTSSPKPRVVQSAAQEADEVRAARAAQLSVVADEGRRVRLAADARRRLLAGRRRREGRRQERGVTRAHAAAGEGRTAADGHGRRRRRSTCLVLDSGVGRIAALRAGAHAMPQQTLLHVYMFGGSAGCCCAMQFPAPSSAGSARSVVL